MWKVIWNLLVNNNWWNLRNKEKKRKVWFFAFVKLDETPSRLDWLSGWNWLQSNNQRKFNTTKQTTISTMAELDYLLLLSASERSAIFFSSTNQKSNQNTHPMLSVFFEWHFREQKHLKRLKRKWKWKSTCWLQISSECKWIFSIMNVVFSEIWNVYSNQIKSNQIILSNITYLIR